MLSFKAVQLRDLPDIGRLATVRIDRDTVDFAYIQHATVLVDGRKYRVKYVMVPSDKPKKLYKMGELVELMVKEVE